MYCQWVEIAYDMRRGLRLTCAQRGRNATYACTLRGYCSTMSNNNFDWCVADHSYPHSFTSFCNVSCLPHVTHRPSMQSIRCTLKIIIGLLSSHPKNTSHYAIIENEHATLASNTTRSLQNELCCWNAIRIILDTTVLYLMKLDKTTNETVVLKRCRFLWNNGEASFVDTIQKN